MHWLYLVPLLALPMAAVHRALTQASEMEHLALHDALTGLPNRALLLQTTARALDGANGTRSWRCWWSTRPLPRRERHARPGAGRRGPQGGRRAAHALGARHRSRRARRERPLRRAAARPGAERRRRARGGQHPRRAEPADGVAGAALSVDATVGIACAPSHAQEADLLLQRAEAAMYRAKRAQSRREFFSLDIEDEAPRRHPRDGAQARHRRARDHALPAEGGPRTGA